MPSAVGTADSRSMHESRIRTLIAECQYKTAGEFSHFGRGGSCAPAARRKEEKKEGRRRDFGRPREEANLERVDPVKLQTVEPWLDLARSDPGRQAGIQQ